jgi:hypothetical protein
MELFFDIRCNIGPQKLAPWISVRTTLCIGDGHGREFSIYHPIFKRSFRKRGYEPWFILENGHKASRSIERFYWKTCWDKWLVFDTGERIEMMEYASTWEQIGTGAP